MVRKKATPERAVYSKGYTHVRSDTNIMGKGPNVFRKSLFNPNPYRWEFSTPQSKTNYFRQFNKTSQLVNYIRDKIDPNTEQKIQDNIQKVKQSHLRSMR